MPLKLLNRPIGFWLLFESCLFPCSCGLCQFIFPRLKPTGTHPPSYCICWNAINTIAINATKWQICGTYKPVFLRVTEVLRFLFLYVKHRWITILCLFFNFIIGLIVYLVIHMLDNGQIVMKDWLAYCLDLKVGPAEKSVVWYLSQGYKEFSFIQTCFRTSSIKWNWFPTAFSLSL